MAPFLVAHRQLLEFFNRIEVGVGGQVDLDVRTFAIAQRRQEVVGCQSGANLGRTDVEGRHPLRFEPDAHGEGARAEDIGPLHPLDG